MPWARTLGQALGLTLGQALGLTLGQARAKTLVQARARPGPTGFGMFWPRKVSGCVATGKFHAETKYLGKSGLSDPISGPKTAKTGKKNPKNLKKCEMDPKIISAK